MQRNRQMQTWMHIQLYRGGWRQSGRRTGTGRNSGERDRQKERAHSGRDAVSDLSLLAYDGDGVSGFLRLSK